MLGQDLAAARDSIVRRDLEAALDALLRAFGAVRAPEIAELVEQVSARLPVAPAIKSRRGSDKFARIEERRRAADVPSQLASAAVVGGLIRMTQRPPDPRIRSAILDILGRLPERSPSAKRYYESLFAALVALGTPETAAALRTAAKAADELGVASFRDWMKEQFARAIADLEALPDPVIDAAERALVAEIATALAARDAACNANVDDLFAQVYADPDDVGARTVLGDRLQEAGDVRGELIALQLRDTLGRTERARVNAIIRGHRAALLGPIAPWVLADGLEFERGFAARGRVQDGMYSPGPPPECVEWSTFVELDVKKEPVVASMLGGPLRALRWLHGASFRIVVTLDRLVAPTRLVHLGIVDRLENERMPNGPALERIAAMLAPGRALEQVVSLAIAISDDDSDQLRGLLGPTLTRQPLATLAFQVRDTARTMWVLAHELAADTIELVSWDGLHVVARRDGARRALTITRGQYVRDETIYAITELSDWASVAIVRS